jgi:3-hydroxymyristoyl/3-hydroxydecanoyl-(acyl carrier protein) dehydratase
VLGRATPGETVEISALCLRRMDGMGLFETQATVGNRQIAQGRFKLFVDIDYADQPSI